MSNKLLFLDTETGGLNERYHSLLTIGIAVWEDSKIIDTKEIYISEENYKVTKQALQVNKINLDELRTKGISPKEAVRELETFCKKYFRFERATLVGYNVNFDIGFLKSLYLKIGKTNFDFESVFSYRSIDTVSLIKYLYIKGILKQEITSSDKAFEYFNIKFKEGTRHTALGDALATAELFDKLLELDIK